MYRHQARKGLTLATVLAASLVTGYTPILSTTLTEADLPYGQLDYTLTLDIVCN